MAKKQKITHREILIITVLVVLVGLFATTGFKGPSLITGAISGKANVTLQSLLSINFVANQDSVTFGSGRVEPTCTNVTLTTNDTSQDPQNCWTGTYGYNTTDNAFEIENDGNRIANVTVNGTNATTFIGGASAVPLFEFFGAQAETNSCFQGLQTSWTTIDDTPQTLCERFRFQKPRDQLYTHIKVRIPEDSAAGTHNATVEFIATLSA